MPGTSMKRITGAIEPLIGGIEGAGTSLLELAQGGFQGLRAIAGKAVPADVVARRVRETLTAMLRTFPWKVRVTDWTGATYDAGGARAHWSGLESLEVRMKTVESGHDLLAHDFMRFIERYLDGEVELLGNLYILAEVRNYAKLGLTPAQILSSRIRNFAFQTKSRARVNVKNHYDIDQRALDQYLDRAFLSYSCAMWKNPADLSAAGVLAIGAGEKDEADTLEAAQWRKFAHGADYLAPGPEETVLDIGCGYGGFLKVTLERHAAKKVVGWTHSTNQSIAGKRVLEGVDPARYEMLEGDYREETRVFDHAHSCGMFCHVGPRGLVPYVQWVRAHVKTGGRYVHHGLMTPFCPQPLETHLGPAFHMRYVWPGFYWFTLGDHVNALEQNGFKVVKIIDLAPHYAKTVFAWYQRLAAKEPAMIEAMGEPTYRAWRLFLAGTVGSFLNRSIHIYRVLCEAVAPEEPSLVTSDPAKNVSAHMAI